MGLPEALSLLDCNAALHFGTVAVMLRGSSGQHLD